MTVIELSDERAAALKAKATADGLSLEEWLDKVAVAEPAKRTPLQEVAEIILSSMRDVPPEIMAAMPKDGASEHDHYIYGWPKKGE